MARVLPRIVGRNGNDGFLAGKAHTDFLDLAVLYRVMIDESASYCVSATLLDSAGITLDELHAQALDNLGKIAEAKSMAEMLGLPAELAGDCDMWVLSTNTRVHGAAVMLLSSVLERMAEHFGGDFWIIPSSVHELIAVPSDHISHDDLCGMIGTVNSEQVTPEEQLAGHPYFYNAQRGVIEL
jgi:hypothetical protein